MSGKRWRSIGFLILLVGVVAFALWFVGSFVPGERREVLTTWRRLLEATVQERAAALQEWRSEGLDVAALAANGPVVMDLLDVDRRPSDSIFPAGVAAGHLADRFAELTKEGRYSGAALFDRDGDVVVSNFADAGRATFSVVVSGVIRGNAPRVDLQEREGESAIITFGVPVSRNGTHVLGALLLVSDAERFLAPLREAAPSIYTTFDVVLVEQRDAQTLRIFSPRRNRSLDAIHQLTSTFDDEPGLPFSEVGDVAFRRVGKESESAVLAASRDIKGTPWRVLAIIDEDEALEEFHRRMLEFSMSYGLLVAALLAVTLGLGWGQRRAYSASLARSAARETERINELTTTLDLVPAAVLMARDRECRTIVGNRAAYEMLREEPGTNLAYSHEGRDGALPPRVFQNGKLVPPDRLPVRRAARDGVEVHGVANEIRFEDGETVHIVGNAAPLWGGDGVPRGAVAAYLDVTAMMRTDAALQSSLSLLESTLEATDDAILVIDLKGRIVLHNQLLIRFWDIPSYILASGDAQRLLEFASRKTREPSALLELARDLRSASDEESAGDVSLIDGRTCEVALKPQLIGDRVVGRVWTFRDITPRRKAEQTMRYAEQQIHQSQKLDAVGRLAGGVAHDLNNVLSIVTGYSDLLLRSLPKDTDSVDKVNAIREAADRAARLTGQLLTFSRRQSLMPSVLDLNEVIRGLQGMLRSLATDAIQVEILLATDLSPILADRGQMEQVIMNLAVNARDAMPSGGTLTIATANVDLSDSAARWYEIEAGRYVRVAMRDTGHGMTREIQNQVFDPFFTTKAAGEGTGLGLATVYGVVNQSGGSVTVDSEPGKGTVFEFVLPIVDAPVELSTTPEGGEKLTRGCETILLVEDEPAVRALTVEVLTEAGYRVLEASGAAEAEVFSEQEGAGIDLVLTDVVMPQVSGPQLAQRLREHRPDLKVLFVSGYADGAASGVELEAGAPFLQKPFPPATLTKKIRELIDG